MKKIILSLISITLLAFTTGGDRSEYNLSKKASSVYAVDYDLDGDNDLIVGHKTMWEDDNTTVTVLNNSNGYFNTDTTFTFTGYQENIFAIRLNDDDYPDLVTFYSDFSSGEAERYIRIFYNDNGNFAQYTDYDLNSSDTYSYITYGDLNCDNLNDLVVVSSINQYWSILYNDGTEGFSEPESFYVYDSYPTDLTIGDLNGDERNDIIIAGSTVEVLINTISGFESFELTENELRTRIADFDHDGDNDVIGISELFVGYYALSFYENIENNAFIEHEELMFPQLGNKIILDDLNKDTFPDIIVILNPEEGIHIHYNNGDFITEDPVLVSIDFFNEYSRKGFVSDLDNNNFNDLITVRYNTTPIPSNLNILFNDGAGNFVEDPIVGITKSVFQQSKQHILNCYPNPFTDFTTIDFTVEQENNIDITIFEINGKKVKTLINKNHLPGKYKIKWNGVDIHKKKVNSGLYFICLNTGRQQQTIRVMKIK